MGNYATDADLVAKRPNVLQLDPDHSTWDFKHTEATEEINHDIELEWYRDNAYARGVDPSTNPFDADLLQNVTRLKNLAVYKTLELIYEYVAKDISDCPYDKERDYFAKKYSVEFKRVMAMGLDYDWNEDSTLDDGEKLNKASPRTLERV